MSNPYLGQITLFAGNFPIRGYSNCDGQLLPIFQNTALFSLLGTMYGGDGRTNFALPDLRGRCPVHSGSGPGLDPVRIGQRGGVTSLSLGSSNLPSHQHPFSAPASNAAADQDSPENHLPATLNQDGYHAGPADTAMGAGTTATAGINSSFDIRNPYLGINYQIALIGTFPSRS